MTHEEYSVMVMALGMYKNLMKKACNDPEEDQEWIKKMIAVASELESKAFKEYNK